MSGVERDIARILDSVEGRSPDTWGLAAARQAEGIRASGVVEVLERGSREITGALDASSERVTTAVAAGASQVSASVASLAAVIGASTSEVTRELARSNAFLEQINDAMRNPKATSADEFYRRGLVALENAWVVEAIDELYRSVHDNPYFAPAHAALGIALHEHQDLAGAAASFRLAVRYSLPNDFALSAGCALLAAETLEEVGDRTAAIEVLDTVLAKSAAVPEVVLSRARLSGDARGVVDALEMAPELAVAAEAGGTPGVRAAAELLTADNSSVMTSTRAALASVEALRGLVPHDDAWRSGSTPSLEGLSTPDQMTTAGRVLGDVRGILAQAQAAAARANAQELRLRNQATLNDHASSSARGSARKEFASLIGTTLLVIAVWVAGVWAFWAATHYEEVGAGLWLLSLVVAIAVLLGGFGAHMLWFGTIGSSFTASRDARKTSQNASRQTRVNDNSAIRNAHVSELQRVANGPWASRVRPWIGK